MPGLATVRPEISRYHSLRLAKSRARRWPGEYPAIVRADGYRHNLDLAKAYGRDLAGRFNID